MYLCHLGWSFWCFLYWVTILVPWNSFSSALLLCWLKYRCYMKWEFKKSKMNVKIRNGLWACHSVVYICSCWLVKPDVFGVSSLSSACLLSVLFTKAWRMLWILSSFIWNIGILVAEVGFGGGGVAICCNWLRWDLFPFPYIAVLRNLMIANCN